MMKRILLLAMMIGALASCSKDESKPFNGFDKITDPLFKEYCGQFDVNYDGVLSEAECRRVDQIDVRKEENYQGAVITSLAGIEIFTELEALACFRNDITWLDVSKNTRLEALSCYANRISSLKLGDNNRLRFLECSENALESLDVTRHTALEILGCWGNLITSIDLSKNVKLTDLECAENLLTSLDVTKNTMLKELGCIGNEITSLDVSQNTDLEILACWDNRMSTLDVRANTELENLVCGLQNNDNEDILTLTLDDSQIEKWNTQWSLNATNGGVVVE